jgi:ferredoxin
MCEFCAEHGEGKQWYLSMKNYSRELLADPRRRDHIAAFFKDFEHSVAGSLSMLDSIQALPFVPDVVSKIATSRQKKGHFGQVVPIEDVDKILDQMSSVVRLPCVCRSLTTGRREVRYCYGLNLDPEGLVTQYPDFDNNLEWLAVEDARSAIHGLDKEGLVHSVWTFDTPFIGGLCNCDQDCMAYRMQVGTGMLQVFFAADYVAAIDWDKCTGCKLCRGQCPFGAIRYTATQDKCQIDANLCYGCGVCRVTCKRNAIDLLPRQSEFKWQRKAGKRAQFKIDVKPCDNPRECRACIDACPNRVFGLAPMTSRDNGKAAADWTVRTLTPSRCTGCRACVEACPQKAITIH